MLESIIPKKNYYQKRTNWGIIKQSEYILPNILFAFILGYSNPIPNFDPEPKPKPNTKHNPKPELSRTPYPNPDPDPFLTNVGSILVI